MCWDIFGMPNLAWLLENYASFDSGNFSGGNGKDVLLSRLEK